jgi:hypothetical protein
MIAPYNEAFPRPTIRKWINGERFLLHELLPELKAALERRLWKQGDGWPLPDVDPERFSAIGFILEHADPGGGLPHERSQWTDMLDAARVEYEQACALADAQRAVAADFPAIKHVLAQYRSTPGEITKDEIEEAWTERRQSSGCGTGQAMSGRLRSTRCASAFGQQATATWASVGRH